MTELESAVADFKAAVENNDEDAAELILVGPFDFIAMEEEPWSDAFFQAVLDMLRDERVVQTRLS